MFSIKNYDTDFVIELELGNTCNFKCSYCFPGSNEGTILWPDVNKIKTSLLQYIKKHNRRTRLYLIGGETTLWKHLPEFCLYLKEHHDVIINISTNASKSLRWWKENYQAFDVVNISVHNEYSDIQHSVQVADFLYEQDIEVNIDVLMDHTNFDKCAQLVETACNSKNKFPVIAKTVIVNGTHKYTNAEHIEYVKSPIKRYPDMDWYNRVKRKPTTTILVDETEIVNNDNYFIINNINYFKNWMCNLGVDLVKIDGRGNVKGNCGQDLAYNIYTSNKLVIEPVMCEQNICICSGETCITKWRPDA